MEKVAEKIVHKYETSSCEEPKEERGKPKSEKKEEMEERVVHLLQKTVDIAATPPRRSPAPLPAPQVAEHGAQVQVV